MKEKIEIDMRTDAYLGGRIERPVPGGEEDSILQSGSGKK